MATVLATCPLLHNRGMQYSALYWQEHFIFPYFINQGYYNMDCSTMLNKTLWNYYEKYFPKFMQIILR